MAASIQPAASVCKICCFAVLLLCCSALPAAAQPVILAPRFVTGQSAVYTVDAEFTRRRAQRDDAPGTRLTQSADLTFVTVSADPDGSAAVRATFERLMVRVETLGPEASSTTWEWRRAAEKPVTDGAGVPGLDEACSALVRSSIQLRVASDGSLRTIEGLERTYEALAASRERGGGPTMPPRSSASFPPAPASRSSKASGRSAVGGGRPAPRSAISGR